MSEDAQISAPEADEPDPELVKAMEARVVWRKGAPYGTRKAGPGRPKGSPKTPGSGRKAGTPNINSPEFREWLAKKAKPFELLASICRGDRIEDGGSKRKPTVAERMRAAETIARKLLPDLQATSLSGPNGGPVSFSDANEMDRIEIGRRVAFLLSSALNEASAAEPARAPQKPQALDRQRGLPSEPPAAPEPAPAPPEPVEVGGLVVTFAEALPGDRERWAIRDGDGRLVGSAMGKLAAIEKARDLNV